jgi:hypothetical protein
MLYLERLHDSSLDPTLVHSPAGLGIHLCIRVEPLQPRGKQRSRIHSVVIFLSLFFVGSGRSLMRPVWMMVMDPSCIDQILTSHTNPFEKLLKLGIE